VFIFSSGQKLLKILWDILLLWMIPYLRFKLQASYEVGLILIAWPISYFMVTPIFLTFQDLFLPKYRWFMAISLCVLVLTVSAGLLILLPMLMSTKIVIALTALLFVMMGIAKGGYDVTVEDIQYNYIEEKTTGIRRGCKEITFSLYGLGYVGMILFFIYYANALDHLWMVFVSAGGLLLCFTNLPLYSLCTEFSKLDRNPTNPFDFFDCGADLFKWYKRICFKIHFNNISRETIVLGLFTFCLSISWNSFIPFAIDWYITKDYNVDSGSENYIDGLRSTLWVVLYQQLVQLGCDIIAPLIACMIETSQDQEIDSDDQEEINDQEIDSNNQEEVDDQKCYHFLWFLIAACIAGLTASLFILIFQVNETLTKIAFAMTGLGSIIRYNSDRIIQFSLYRDIDRHNNDGYLRLLFHVFLAPKTDKCKASIAFSTDMGQIVAFLLSPFVIIYFGYTIQLMASAIFGSFAFVLWMVYGALDISGQFLILDNGKRKFKGRPKVIFR
jgi:hypothetical protein